MSHAKDKAAELQTPQISDETDASREAESTTDFISAMQRDHLLIFEHEVKPACAGAISEMTQELDPPSLFNGFETDSHLDPGSRYYFDEAHLKYQPSHETDESNLPKSPDWSSYDSLISEPMQSGINAHEPNALSEAWCPGERGCNSIGDTLAPGSVFASCSYGLTSPPSPPADLGEVGRIL